MAKINETYEAMVVFSLKQGEDGIKALTEKFKGMMAEAGTVESVDEWGKRKLLCSLHIHICSRFPRRAGPCTQDHRRRYAFTDYC